MSRGFSTMIGEGKYGKDPVIIKLSNVIDFDLSFLLESEYSDPDNAYYWANLANIEAKTIKQDTFRKNTFWEIQSFHHKIQELIIRLQEVPNYHERINYDKEVWQNYFGEKFQEDLNYLSATTEEILQNGFRWVSFEIS